MQTAVDIAALRYVAAAGPPPVSTAGQDLSHISALMQLHRTVRSIDAAAVASDFAPSPPRRVCMANAEEPTSQQTSSGQSRTYLR